MSRARGRSSRSSFSLMGLPSGGGGGAYTYSQVATPASPSVGETWLDGDGNSWIYYDDGDSQAWVQYASVN